MLNLRDPELLESKRTPASTTVTRSQVISTYLNATQFTGHTWNTLSTPQPRPSPSELEPIGSPESGGLRLLVLIVFCVLKRLSAERGEVGIELRPLFPREP